MIQSIESNEFFQYINTTFLDGDIPVIRVVIIFIVLHYFAHYIVFPYLNRKAEQHQSSHLKFVTHHHLFHYAVLTFQGGILSAQLSLVQVSGGEILGIIIAGSHIWMLTFALLTFYSFIDLSFDLLNNNKKIRVLPYRGIEQTLKLVGALLYIIFLVSILLNKSPFILLSGLSAVAAVLLLVFKDPLLGLVAGIQLSANNMLITGDWIELDRLGANGVVQDIGLTTVKVLNFDNTITTIPTYTLVSEAFKNWRYMDENRARRIQRYINIDIKTIKFLSPEEKNSIINKAELTLLNDIDLNIYNTNIELFQKYTNEYLTQHKSIHQNMTLMVRQLQPTIYGLPVELYAFTELTEWVAYEKLQTEILSHIISAITLFNLKVHDIS